jgi:hypothetical protein
MAAKMRRFTVVGRQGRLQKTGDLLTWILKENEKKDFVCVCVCVLCMVCVQSVWGVACR